MGVETIAIASLAAAAAHSVYQGQKERKIQKRAARQQQKAIDEQKEQALADRKQQINQMRMQMGGTGEGTRGTTTSGVSAQIGGGTNGNTLG